MYINAHAKIQKYRCIARENTARVLHKTKINFFFYFFTNVAIKFAASLHGYHLPIVQKMYNVLNELFFTFCILLFNYSTIHLVPGPPCTIM